MSNSRRGPPRNRILRRESGGGFIPMESVRWRCYADRVRKRSITIRGHRTSILLEAEYWAALETAARLRAVSLPSLVAEIDSARMKRSPPPGLASALRVFALAESQKSGVGDKTG